MTKLLAEAITAVLALPPQSQQEIARAMLDLAAEGEHLAPLTEADAEAIDRGLADIKAGRIATPEEVAAVFARHGVRV
jgi:putative addiction module component (TIGR02574 family)